jgi:hypothetical protein
MPTKIDGNKFVEHLKQKWGTDRPCSMCGASDWNVTDSVFEMREYHGPQSLVMGGPINPIIPVICKNCGNTVLVNAVVSGFLNVEKEVNR